MEVWGRVRWRVLLSEVSKPQVLPSYCVQFLQLLRQPFFFSYFLTDFALVAPVYYGGNKAEILLYLGGVYLGLMEPYNGQPSRTIMMKNVDKVGWV
jgi:hypothetical protein